MSDNIVEFNEFTISDKCEKDQVCCWLCQKTTSLRALFCHHCGTIQPVRPLDHFARLGLDRRIDVDSEVLEHQYSGLKRTLDPTRFAIRGMGERSHAQAQLKAIEEAFNVLREPLKRGRYWIELHEKEIDESEAKNPMINDLRSDLESAKFAMQCDKIAQKAGNAMEQGIVGLMKALRSKKWQLANAILLEVDGLESILKDVRGRRSEMLETNEDHEGVSRIK